MNISIFESQEGAAMPHQAIAHSGSHPKGDNAKRAADLEAIARLIEDLIPHFKHLGERQFYREVLETYRSAAREILWNAWAEREE